MKQSLLILILAISLTALNSCDIVINNEKFDSEKWKNGNERTRGGMVYDLQNSKILIGKNKAEVASLLGKDEYPLFNTRTYDIDTNIPVDIYFTIHFDEKTEKVVSTDIGD